MILLPKPEPRCQYSPQRCSQPEPLDQSHSIERHEAQAVLPHSCPRLAITVVSHREMLANCYSSETQHSEQVGRNQLLWKFFFLIRSRLQRAIKPRKQKQWGHYLELKKWDKLMLNCAEKHKLLWAKPGLQISADILFSLHSKRSTSLWLTGKANK